MNNDERDWIFAKDKENPGSFLRAMLTAAMAADPQNYVILQPVIRKLMEKYPARETR